MRNYHYRSKSAYYLPRNVYLQVKYKVADYLEMKSLADSMCFQSGGSDGQPKAKNNISDSTALSAIRREKLTRDLTAIEKAAMDMPGECPEYFKKSLYGEPLPPWWPNRTKGRYRQMFYYKVAQNLGLV